jgi:hypothetical protein
MCFLVEVRKREEEGGRREEGNGRSERRGRGRPKVGVEGESRKVKENNKRCTGDFLKIPHILYMMV